jgi:hypothetical protein
MYWITLLAALSTLVQTASQAPDVSSASSGVTTFRTTRKVTSAQRARAAMMPKYASSSASISASLSGAKAAQSKASALVTLNRAKRSSQYVPEDINDKVSWKRNGIATATPWDREVGGWDKRPDWKPKSTWDGTLTRVSGGNLAGTATSGRQTYDVKHPNLVVNGKVPVKRR